MNVISIDIYLNDVPFQVIKANDHVPQAYSSLSDFFLSVVEDQKRLRVYEKVGLKNVYKNRRLEKLQTPEAAISMAASLCVFLFFYILSNIY